MRRKLCLILLALVLVLLWGCGQETTAGTEILVNIREGQGFTVVNNGQRIQPGEDAVFLLKMDEGLSVAGVAEDFACHTALENGMVKLTLKNVERPAHVDLRLTESYEIITYQPNGGDGAAVTAVHDTTNHLRPNTDTGHQLFTREGYTLVSWNTQLDGTGERVGLGSRVTVAGERLTLYAQWARWTDSEAFRWTENENGITITGYRGDDPQVVIPAAIDGRAVTTIAAGAFQNIAMEEVVFPASLMAVEDGAFQNCGLSVLTLFDNIETVGDGAFVDCQQLMTLRINAIEAPYGANYRKESYYADKVDLLIQAQGEKKIVFYAGCSMWYNLDGALLTPLLAQGYQVVNMGLNGMANSAVQTQIMEHFLEPGDIFFHTPELCSDHQMMLTLNMGENADKLWCGIEYNYDIFTLVDMRTVSGVLDSFRDYLDRKKSGTDYTAVRLEDGNGFCDDYGCIPFERTITKQTLADEVYMDPSYITEKGMERLKAVYDRYQAKGVRIYVSYACMNMDAVPEEQIFSVEMVDARFHKAIRDMGGPVLISNLEDYLYYHDDFFDTNYHLNSEAARRNTAAWLRDLQAQMERDGLWEAP